jgi:hypothetical protein
MIEWRGKKYHASFVENSISGDMQTIDLFSLAGVQIEMRRVESIKYNSDGSIYMPWWYKSADAFAGVADATAITAWPDMYGTGPTFTLLAGTTAEVETVDKPLSYVRFAASAAVATLSAPKTFYDIFLVMGARGTTWNALARACLSDATHTFLQGASATAHFEDLSLTSFEYRKNGTLLTAAGASPMDVYAVIHLRFTAGQSFATVLAIAESYATGFNAPINVSEMIFCDEQLTAAQYANIVTGLMTQEAIT